MTKTEQLVNLAGLARVAGYAATTTDACAANGWKITRTAWECVSDSVDAAVDYWLMVAREDGTDRACEEIDLALEWVGQNIGTVCHRMS